MIGNDMNILFSMNNDTLYGCCPGIKTLYQWKNKGEEDKGVSVR